MLVSNPSSTSCRKVGFFFSRDVTVLKMKEKLLTWSLWVKHSQLREAPTCSTAAAEVWVRRIPAYATHHCRLHYDVSHCCWCNHSRYSYYETETKITTHITAKIWLCAYKGEWLRNNCKQDFGVLRVCAQTRNVKSVYVCIYPLKTTDFLGTW